MSIHWFLDNFVKYLITGKRNHENILVEWKRWIRQTITRKRYCGIIVSARVQVVRRRTKLLLQSLSFTRMMKWLAHKRKHLSYVHHDKSVLGYFHRDYVFHWDFVKYMSAVQNNFVSVLCESKLRLEQEATILKRPLSRQPLTYLLKDLIHWKWREVRGYGHYHNSIYSTFQLDICCNFLCTFMKSDL